MPRENDLLRKRQVKNKRQRQGGRGLQNRRGQHLITINRTLELRESLQGSIDGAVWKEIRKHAYPKESAAGIRRARERKAGRLPDLTGLGKIATLESFAGSIKDMQGQWGRMSFNKRVNAIGKAASMEMTIEGVSALLVVNTEKMEFMGYFDAARWRLCISEDLVSGRALSDADAAELCNTVMHEARHAEQRFLAARFSAGPPANKSAAAIARELGIPISIAQAAVAARFDATTDPKVAALGKKMHNAMVAKGEENQKISDDDYLAEMAIARDEATKSAIAHKAKATDVTSADATTKLNNLKATIAEVERRYTLYRNIPYEADAHEVGDAAELAFKEWV